MDEIENRGNCVMFPALFMRPDGTYAVLAGERRVQAMLNLGFGTIGAHEIRTWAEFATWLRRDRHTAQELKSAPTPMNAIEAGTLGNQVRELLAPKKSDWPDQMLAGYVSLPLEQFRDGRYLVARLASDDASTREAAKEAVRLVLAGEVSASTAIKAIGKSQRAAITARAELGPIQQRKVIGNAVNQAAGLVMGLDAVGLLSEHLTSEERAQWAGELRKSRRAFDRFIRRLEGRA